jgi:DNA-binding NarL/FixJ family response regulator
VARLLLVDDDLLFAESVALVLSGAGYEATLARTAREGARRLEQERFDLVIADIRMDGNEHLEWVRELARERPGLPLVVVTGYPSLETAVDAVRLPVRAYLLKPLTPERLLDEVARCLEESTRGDIGPRLAALTASWGLTPREAEVLEALVRGASNKEIAAAFGCARRTVEIHVTSVLRKSSTTSRTELVADFWQAEQPHAVPGATPGPTARRLREP